MWSLMVVLAAAPVSPESSALSFDEAMSRADVVGDVASASRAVQVRREGQYTSVFTSNPQLVAQPALRTENGAARPEGQLTLTQSINLGGLGAARAATQRSELELSSVEHRLLRQERRLAIAAAWLELWGAQEASRLAHDEEQHTRALVERLQTASASGTATRVELAVARAFAAELAALHLEWEGRRVEAGAAVAELVGLPTLAEAVGPVPESKEVEVAVLRAGDLLQVKQAEREVVTERARLDESLAQYGTQLQLSVLGGHEAPSQWIVGAGVGLTLPLLEQGRRERVGHQATLARLSGAESLAVQRAEVRLRVLRHELEHTAETLRVVGDELLPAAEEAVALETRRYQQGEATLLEVTTLRRHALNARIAAVLARARWAAARQQAREFEVQP